MKLTIDISGKEAILKAFDKFIEEAEEEVKTQLEIKSLEIAGEAKRNAPVDLGELKSGIANVPTPGGDGLDWQIVSKAPYSAYIEFGTGKKVDIPAEFADEAAKFKGKGKGDFKDFIKRITAWAKRQGLEEDAVWPIAMSILNKGIEPHPFMYPAYKYGEKTFVKDMDLALKRLIDKFGK